MVFKSIVGKANNSIIYAIIYTIFSFLIALELLFIMSPSLLEIILSHNWEELIGRLTVFAGFLYLPAIVLSKFHKLRSKVINGLVAIYIIVMYCILKISYNKAHEIVIEIKAFASFLIIFTAIPYWIHSVKLALFGSG